MKTKDGKDKEVFVLLSDIRSVLNAGAIFRTAESADVSKIFLSGYTPAPLDRFGRVRKDFAKASLGAEKFIEWQYVKNVTSFFKKMKEKSVSIVCVEQSNKALEYKKFKPEFPILFVFGNETKGISKKTLSKADRVIEIPMYGKKESLNVSVAAGIILFHYLPE